LHSSSDIHYTRFSGTKAGVEENIGLVRSIAKCYRAGDFVFALSEEEKNTLWSARKEALWSMLALRKDGTEVWSTDVAVPLSRLPDIIGMISPGSAI
jgi:D-lactate dehydrogenase (cytochrome)